MHYPGDWKRKIAKSLNCQCFKNVTHFLTCISVCSGLPCGECSAGTLMPVNYTKATLMIKWGAGTMIMILLLNLSMIDILYDRLRGVLPWVIRFYQGVFAEKTRKGKSTLNIITNYNVSNLRYPYALLIPSFPFGICTNPRNYVQPGQQITLSCVRLPKGNLLENRTFSQSLLIENIITRYQHYYSETYWLFKCYAH